MQLEIAVKYLEYIIADCLQFCSCSECILYQVFNRVANNQRSYLQNKPLILRTRFRH